MLPGHKKMNNNNNYMKTPVIKKSSIKFAQPPNTLSKQPPTSMSQYNQYIDDQLINYKNEWGKFGSVRGSMHKENTNLELIYRQNV